MKKLVLASMALSCAILFVSCGPAKKVSSYSMAPYRNVTGVGVVNIPTLADLEVSQDKIFEKETVKVESTDVNISDETIENAVNRVLSGLLLKRNADVLVQPVTRVETKGRMISIEVSGYPATYKNFRAMTPKDAELFRNINILHIPQGVVQSVITTGK